MRGGIGQIIINNMNRRYKCITISPSDVPSVGSRELITILQDMAQNLSGSAEDGHAGRAYELRLAVLHDLRQRTMRCPDLTTNVPDLVELLKALTRCTKGLFKITG